jgi:hypothetical protein
MVQCKEPFSNKEGGEERKRRNNAHSLAVFLLLESMHIAQRRVYGVSVLRGCAQCGSVWRRRAHHGCAWHGCAQCGNVRRRRAHNGCAWRGRAQRGQCTSGAGNDVAVHYDETVNVNGPLTYR